MKPLCFLLFFLLLLSVNSLKGQSNSIVLIPPSGPAVFYPCITSAYAAIPSGLPSGNDYIIELLPAYNGTDPSEIYPIQLTNKNLLPGGATITIRPAAGNTGETIKKPVAGAGNTVEINGGDNIIIDGRPGGIISVQADFLTIADFHTPPHSNTNMRLINGATNNIIQYINFTALTGPAINSSGHRLLSITLSPAGLPNNNNLITHNAFTGGERSIDLGGSVVHNTGNIISNNTLTDFATFGIFSSGVLQENTTIQNNAIIFTCPVSRIASTGIHCQGGLTIFNVLNNTITSNISVPSGTPSLTAIQTNLATGTVANIRNNTITNLQSPDATLINGITTASGGNINIENNTIGNFYSPLLRQVACIVAAPVSLGTTCTISKNNIFSISSNDSLTVGAITFYTLTGDCQINVNNNFVLLTDPNPRANLIRGISLVHHNTDPAPYITNVFFNSIRIGGIQTGGTAGEKKAACIWKPDANTPCTYSVKNNICIMERAGGSPGIIMAGLMINSTLGTLDIDHNTYYGADLATNSYPVCWVNTAYSNTQLENYKTDVSPNEQNSNFTNVIFQSATDLHLAGASLTDPALNGTPIVGITTDIDNDPRKIVIPTKGADENMIPAPITNTRSGNWSDPTIWSNNAVPLITDNVLLKFDVIVDINAFCRSLNISGKTITVNAGLILTVAN